MHWHDVSQRQLVDLQDKENRQTPNTAYVSSRLGIASPAVHTPSHTSASQPSSVADQAVAQAIAPVDNSDALSTPSAFTHLTPSLVNNSHSTPTSAAASAMPSEAVLPIRTLGERAHSRPGAPHSSALQDGSLQNSLPEQQHDKGSQAEVSPVAYLITVYVI